MGEAAAAGAWPLEDFRAFCRQLAAVLDVPEEGWQPQDPLVATLGWDSLCVVEVLTWLDEQGIRLPDELVGELRTLADLHHYAVTIGSRPPEAPAHRRRPLEGRRVRLLPLAPEHTPAALALHTEGEHLTRYRLRGTTPSPEAFHRALWERTLAQFVVVQERSVLALASAFEADLRNRHVHVAVVAAPAAPPGVGIEGLALLVEHLFAEFDLRKVYAEVLAPHLDAFASGVGRVFVVEGRLTAHEYLDGAYRDVVVLALTRERWAAAVDGILGPPAA